MKNTFRNISIFVIGLITTLSLIACEKEEMNPQNGNKIDQNPHMNVSLSYVGGKLVNVRSGTERLTFSLEDGETGSISFSITNVAGSIDIKIYRDDDTENPEFEEFDIQSSSFSINLSQKGQYIIWISARSFAGKYDIAWNAD